ncbi:hypothetical protein [Wolbachia endosymbiont (group E) of Neria commutata]|uniref:hypothetical protein n=1 Tax=Wolbachia endosymbiont (group E) of Neria commutata TaxID=3066149 RepID=UPI003132A237
MEPIFPAYASKSANLPIWQSNVVRFLSNHRKYRILWWEFGPTLLNHLHKVKEDTKSDYTKNGLILTYSIASAALLISLASTRKVAFTAAVTSGVILLGITTTVAIDYQKTKRKGASEAVDQEYCLELLNLLGEMPKYWWWPWSPKLVRLF